jgi:hypothetical protein
MDVGQAMNQKILGRFPQAPDIKAQAVDFPGTWFGGRKIGLSWFFWCTVLQISYDRIVTPAQAGVQVESAGFPPARE